jgi:hypothetical protein
MQHWGEYMVQERNECTHTHTHKHKKSRHAKSSIELHERKERLVPRSLAPRARVSAVKKENYNLRNLFVELIN